MNCFGIADALAGRPVDSAVFFCGILPGSEGVEVTRGVAEIMRRTGIESRQKIRSAIRRLCELKIIYTEKLENQKLQKIKIRAITNEQPIANHEIPSKIKDLPSKITNEQPIANQQENSVQSLSVEKQRENGLPGKFAGLAKSLQRIRPRANRNLFPSEKDKKNLLHTSGPNVQKPDVSARRREQGENYFWEIPLRCGGVFPVSLPDLERLQLGVSKEEKIRTMNKIRSWCQANPVKRKTKRGFWRFVNGWFSREQERRMRYDAKKGDHLPVNATFENVDYSAGVEEFNRRG